MKPNPNHPSNAALAEKWRCSERTIRNWRKIGLNLANDAAVARFIIASKKATPRQLAAVADILAEKLP